MTLVEELCDDLRANGLPDTYVIEGAPDEKDNAISLTPYLGSAIESDQSVVGDEQNIQCFVRGSTYVSAYALAWDSYNFLMAKNEEQADYAGYGIVEFLQSPTYLRRDEKGRHMFSFNMRLRKIFTS